MVKFKQLSRFVFVSLIAFMAVMTIPKHLYAQATDPVVVAEAAIDNYFTVLLSGQDATQAYNTMQTAKAAVNPVYTFQVNNYYEHASFIAAEKSIDNYFTVVLTGLDSTQSQQVMNTARSLLVFTDTTSVNNYYDRASLIAAEQSIDNYFATILSGQDTTLSYRSMNTARGSLSFININTVDQYYQTKAFPTAETAIDQSFQSILLGQDPVRALNIIATARAVVSFPYNLSVDNYYQQVSVRAAETSIDQYFLIKTLNQDLTSAQAIMNAARGAVNNLDRYQVDNYYNQQVLTPPGVTVNLVEVTISQYFQKILAGLDTTQTLNVINAALLTTNTSNRNLLNKYYSQISVLTAEGAINQYFLALSKGQDATQLQNIMNTSINANLRGSYPQSKVKVNTYYNQRAFNTAKAAMDQYFLTKAAGGDTTYIQAIMNATKAAVKDPQGLSSISAYYSSISSIPTSPLAKVEWAIDRYFDYILSGGDSTTASNTVDPSNAINNLRIIENADFSDSYNWSGYYAQGARTTANQAIDTSFKAILAGQDANSALSIIHAAMGAVIDPSDSQSVGSNYNQTARATANQAIFANFQAILAGDDGNSALSIIHAAMGAVTNPNDSAMVQSNYDQTARTTAIQAISTNFQAILVGGDANSALSIINVAMGAVTNANDTAMVQSNYDQTAKFTALQAIDNYVQVLFSGQNPNNAQNIMNAAIGAVSNYNDKAQVNTYYTQRTQGPILAININSISNGQATITSTPAGINCSNYTASRICAAKFIAGANIVLNVTPNKANGSRLTNWGISKCDSSSSCSFTIGTNPIVESVQITGKEAPAVGVPVSTVE